MLKSMFHPLLVLSTAAAMIFGAAACTEDGGEDSTPKYATPDDAVKAVADALFAYQCDSAFQCPEQEADMLLFYGRFANAAECKRVMVQNSLLFNDVIEGVKAGRIKYDAAKAAQCVPKIQQTYKNQVCKTGDFPDEPSECEEVFLGQVAQDAKCIDGQDCQGDLVCNFEGGECYGVCKKDECAPGIVCKDDELCQLTDGTAACVKPLAIDAECTFADNCVDGASCYYGDQETGKCVADYTLDEGVACDFDEQCKRGLTCDEDDDENTVCVKAPVTTLVDAGQDCILFGAAVCKPGLTCQDVNLLDGLKGKCAAPVAKGGDCQITFQCAHSLFCQGGDLTTMTKGKCADLLANGQTCEEDDNCQSQECGEDKKCKGAQSCTI